LSIFSQDTIKNNITDSVCLLNNISLDTNNANIDLTPIVFKKFNDIYFGFDKKQSEYLYNSLQQRDFYKLSYFEKIKDFNNIIVLYDNEIINLKEKNTLNKQIILTQDTIIKQKTKEIIEKENIYIKQIKKQKRKTFFVTSGSIIVVVLTVLILI
jgi:hypothetical protein